MKLLLLLAFFQLFSHSSRESTEFVQTGDIQETQLLHWDGIIADSCEIQSTLYFKLKNPLIKSTITVQELPEPSLIQTTQVGSSYGHIHIAILNDIIFPFHTVP